MANFFHDAMATAAARALAAIFGLLSTIIIARVLGPAGQGVFSLAILLPTTLLAFSTLGVNISATYFASRKNYSLSQIFGASIFFSIVLGILTTAVGLAVIWQFQGQLFREVPSGFLMAALFLIPFNLALELFLPIILGMQKISGYNYFSLLQSFIFLVMAIIIGLESGGVFMFIVAQIISFALVATALFFYVLRLTGGRIEMPRLVYLKDAISYGIKNYLGGVVVFFHYRVDALLINYFINPLAVGLYFTATKLAESIWFFSQSASNVLFPKVAAESDDGRLKEFTPSVCRNVLFITALISLGLWIFSKYLIVLFYSQEFILAVEPFRILLIGALFVSGWKILANDIAARGNPMANTWIIAAATVFNIAFNIYAIPIFGIIGAAWSSAASYFLMFAVTVILYKKISRANLRDILFINKSDLDRYWNIGNIWAKKIYRK